VNEQRPHDENSSARDQAIYSGCSCAQVVDCIVAQDAHRVRFGEDAQWTIFGSRVVEMEAQRHDAGKRAGWSVGVNHSILYRPRSPLR
jgi:hypothetical protein